MKQYVIRRAAEEKNYRQHAAAAGVNVHWLTKLAQGRLANPNYNDIELLAGYYRALEQGMPWERQQAPELALVNA